jgi:hypothetical protein
MNKGLEWLQFMRVHIDAFTRVVEILLDQFPNGEADLDELHERYETHRERLLHKQGSSFAPPVTRVQFPFALAMSKTQYGTIEIEQSEPAVIRLVKVVA